MMLSSLVSVCPYNPNTNAHSSRDAVTKENARDNGDLASERRGSETTDGSVYEERVRIRYYWVKTKAKGGVTGGINGMGAYWGVIW